MGLEKENVLMFTRSMDLGGTENVVLQICQALAPHVNKIVVCSSGGVNVKKLNEMGIRHYTIPDITTKTLSTMLLVMREVSEIIQREQITTVHTHHRMATFYMFLMNKKLRLHTVSTLHGEFHDKKALTTMAYRHIPIIACGSGVKDNFVNYYGIESSHITVIRNAVAKDVSAATGIEELGSLPQGYKRVAYVGRLSKEKGVDVLLEAMSALKGKGAKICLVVAGSGDMDEELRTQAAELGIDDIVVFLGYRSDAQNVIKQADATVLPSFTEGLPLSPVESFAQGKPVVATRVNGTVEILSDGKNGILVPPHDVQALSDALVKIFNNDEEYMRMCVEAATTYEKSFNLTSFNRHIVDFYRKECGHNG